MSARRAAGSAASGQQQIDDRLSGSGGSRRERRLDARPAPATLTVDVVIPDLGARPDVEDRREAAGAGERDGARLDLVAHVAERDAPAFVEHDLSDERRSPRACRAPADPRCPVRRARLFRTSSDCDETTWTSRRVLLLPRLARRDARRAALREQIGQRQVEVARVASRAGRTTSPRTRLPVGPPVTTRSASSDEPQVLRISHRHAAALRASAGSPSGQTLRAPKVPAAVTSPPPTLARASSAPPLPPLEPDRPFDAVHELGERRPCDTCRSRFRSRPRAAASRWFRPRGGRAFREPLSGRGRGTRASSTPDRRVPRPRGSSACPSASPMEPFTESASPSPSTSKGSNGEAASVRENRRLFSRRAAPPGGPAGRRRPG